MSSKNTKNQPKKASEGLQMRPRAIIIGIIVLCVILAGVVFAIIRSFGVNPFTGEQEGYIDCMPPLSEIEVARCDQAEKWGLRIVH